MKSIKQLLRTEFKNILLLSSWELEQDKILAELVGDLCYEQQYNTSVTYNISSCYYVVADTHPNISFILLRVKNPVWISGIRD